MTHLLITVHFLDDRYHGLLKRSGPQEWPPSPLRLFCALVAGVARRDELEGDIGKALKWLQALDPPMIVAPKHMPGQAIVRYVPNNDGDKKPDRQDRLTAKPTIPTLMRLGPGDKPEVHFVWDIEEKTAVPFGPIRDAARSLTALGWGVDMAFADAKTATDVEIQMLSGIRWYPKVGVWNEDGMLRVPSVNADLQECTLCDLMHCHETAMARVEHSKPLHTVDRPRVFDRVFYASVERPLGRPYRLFELCKTDGDGERDRYPHRKLIHIAGMVRHLAIDAMTNAPPRGVEDTAAWVESYIAGHLSGEDKERGKVHRQLSYLPLPSVGTEHTDPGIRRMMITAPVGDDAWLDHVARRLAGQMLKPLHGDEFPGGDPPLLVPLPRRGDGVTRRYTDPANVWHSFTPVILPGHDDHKPAKTRRLIEAALAQSGIEQPCDFEWGPFSRFRKSLSAHKYSRDGKPSGYFRPDHLQSQTAVHLMLRFRDQLKVPGPLVIGAGRHCGFGLMASIAASANS